MKERLMSSTAVALVILAALLLVYAGGYWMLLDDVSWDVTIVRTGSGRIVVQRVVAYRWGGEAARVAFAPAHRIDRWLRADFWEVGPAGIDSDIEAVR